MGELKEQTKLLAEAKKVMEQKIMEAVDYFEKETGLFVGGIVAKRVIQPAMMSQPPEVLLDKVVCDVLLEPYIDDQQGGGQQQ